MQILDEIENRGERAVDQPQIYSPMPCFIYGNFCLIEHPFGEKGPRDLPDFFARPPLNLPLALRGLCYTPRRNISLGKLDDNCANIAPIGSWMREGLSVWGSTITTGKDSTAKSKASYSARVATPQGSQRPLDLIFKKNSAVSN